MNKEYFFVRLSSGNGQFVRCRLLSRLGTFKAVEQFMRSSAIGKHGESNLKLVGFLDHEILNLAGASYERLTCPDRHLALMRVWKRFLDCQSGGGPAGYRLRFRLENHVQEATNSTGFDYLRLLTEAAEAALLNLADRYRQINELSYMLSSRTVCYGKVIDVVLFPYSEEGVPIPAGLSESGKSGTLEEVASGAFREAVERKVASFHFRTSPSALLLVLAVHARMKSAEGSARERPSIDAEAVRGAFRSELSSRRKMLHAAVEMIAFIEGGGREPATSSDELERMKRDLDEQVAGSLARFTAASTGEARRRFENRPISHSPPSLPTLVQAAWLVEQGVGDIALQFLAFEDPACRRFSGSMSGGSGVDLSKDVDVVRLAKEVVAGFGNAVALKKSVRKFLFRCRKALAFECLRQESLRNRSRMDSLRELEGCLVARKALDLELLVCTRGVEKGPAARLLERAKREADYEILPSFVGESGPFIEEFSDVSQVPTPVAYAAERKAIKKRLLEGAGPLLSRPHSKAFAMGRCQEEGASVINRICNRFLEKYKTPK